ncbi:hypothetical protein D3C85_1755780 [compost metagenome]
MAPVAAVPAPAPAPGMIECSGACRTEVPSRSILRPATDSMLMAKVLSTFNPRKFDIAMPSALSMLSPMKVERATPRLKSVLLPM